MAKLKRSRYFYVFLEDKQLLDVTAFLSGSVGLSREPCMTAFSVLTEEQRPLAPEELSVLLRIPDDAWLSETELDPDRPKVEGLLEAGLVLSSSDDPRLSRLREREERLRDKLWKPYAAFYHFMSRRPAEIGADKGPVDVAAAAGGSRQSFARFVERHGPPPPPFPAPRAGDGTVVDLPRVEKSGGLYETLAKRRTTRAFDGGRSMRLEDLDVVLRHVFGCHGYARLSEDVTLLRRTSPSGGSLHPIEVYPLIRDVAGLEAGLYHYEGAGHRLRRLRRIEPVEVAELAARILAGQSFAASAHVLLILSARFERNFWKYRQTGKTYGVILTDAGHLSQTFYLVCGDLGLACFYSAALHAPLAEEVLELDGISEGALGVCGCGVRTPGGADLGLDFQPFEPGGSEL